MNFELPTATKCKLVDIDILSMKNRPPDSNPGVALAFTAELPNSALTMLDGFLRGMLYTKQAGGDAQKGLDGVEPVSDLPNLTQIGQKIGRFSWLGEQTGCTLTFDFGLGGKSNIVLGDVKVDALHITPKEGGTTTWQWKCEINDVSEAEFGKIATFKSRDVQLLIALPDVEQQDLEDDPPPQQPARRGRKPKAATSEPEGEWPFPGDGPGEQTPESAFVGTASD